MPVLYKYTADERDEAINLFLSTFAAEPFNYDWLRREDVLRYFIDLENTPGALSFLYYDDRGLLLGLCFGTTNDYFRHKLYEIKEFAIRRDAQGGGNGGRMIAQVAKYLKKHEFEAITLSTQRDIAAYEFYVKNGFVDLKQSATLSKRL